MQVYTVASGIIVDRQQLLLVQNQRRNGSRDWSTPGGVVDPGEEVIQALQREVIEETAVVVDGWSPLRYSVQVEFVERSLALDAQVFEAESFGGSLHVDDPDNVVVDGRWVDQREAHELLGASPQWVAEPLRHAITQLFSGDPWTSSAHWKYRVTGHSGDFEAELVHFEP